MLKYQPTIAEHVEPPNPSVHPFIGTNGYDGSGWNANRPDGFDVNKA